MSTSEQNVDPNEVAHFESLGEQWWDPHGDFKTLHEINPLRVEYIVNGCELASARALDVGCGGGLLTEALARNGAQAIGLDLSKRALAAAAAHALSADLDIGYECAAVEAYAEAHAGQFDVVTCMEMMEHVPDPASIVAACATLVRPGGHVFFSTINRTPAAYALAVVGAEYVLNLVPRGTHEYAKFIRPSELDTWARHHALILQDLSGLRYDPVLHNHAITRNVQVNYMTHHIRRTEDLE